MYRRFRKVYTEKIFPEEELKKVLELHSKGYRNPKHER